MPAHRGVTYCPFCGGKVKQKIMYTYTVIYYCSNCNRYFSVSTYKNLRKEYIKYIVDVNGDECM